MSDTQANTIRNLLLAALSKYDSSIDLQIGSRAYAQIVTPIYDALSPDFFDTDLDEYLLSVLSEEYPSLELQEGDVIVDLLIKPLRLILEPIKTELALLKKRQSTAYTDSLTLEDAEDLAANFFVTRKRGSRARGVVRILLTQPTFLTISDQVRFSTADGLRFYPLRQEFINAETTALQQIGDLYYVDIGVIAELEGEEYNIPASSITITEGIPNFVNATNPFAFEQGSHSETKSELLSRTEESLTERSLTSRKGITARIHDEFDEIRSVSIVGYGDPEMERDVLTGSGNGHLIASGISFILGRYMFMITGYEDSEGGSQLPAVGDLLKLNFWKFMYTESSVEDNHIQEVIYTSYGDAPDLPTVHILLLKENIQRPPLLGGYLPGVYLGVFTSIFSDPTITISGLPVGVDDPAQALPTRIKSNEVHIGGKYDVWIRPSAVDTSTSSISLLKSPNIEEDLVVFFDGNNLSTLLTGKYPLNRAGLPYYVEVPSHSLYPREPVIGSTSQALGFIHSVESNRLYLTARTGSFKNNETITGLVSGNTSVIQNIVYTTAKKKHIGSVITTTDPENSYFIVDVYENYYILSVDVEEGEEDVPAYIHKTTGLDNIFDPVFKIYPEVAKYSTNLQTFIGKSTVDILANIEEEGVEEGDVLEILSGEDIGRYTIESIISSSPNSSSVTIDTMLSRTNSGVRFKIVREGASLDAPLVRINPSGVIQSSGVGSGYEIPYKKPVGAYALGAFSGSIAKYDGLNGFVLPNMDSSFKGSGSTVGSLASQARPAFLSLFSNASVDDCISEGCDACDDITVVCTVTIDGTPTNYSAVHFYITDLLSTSGISYLQDFKKWLLQLVTAFFQGQNTQNQSLYDDLTAAIQQFAPISFGEPPVTENIIKQFELCIPTELFDGCNNTYMAIPEFIWDSEFDSTNTFASAINEFLSGRMRAKATSLKYAKEGDSLHIKSGANQGEYVIHKVLNIPWYHGDTISTESTIDENGVASVTASIVDNKAYDFTLVVIKGSFPNEVLKGSSEYFSGSLPTVQSLLPSVPVSTLNTIHTIDIATGAFKNPFDVIQEAYTLLFKAMYTQGFDLPETFDLQPGPVLTKITKSFFSNYTIGNRSPQQTTRILFQDAVDTTVYAPRACSSISWKKEVPTVASISGEGLPIHVPIANLGTSTITVYTTLNSNQSSKTYTGVVEADASTATNIEDIVNYIQSALDPTSSELKVTYTEPTPGNYIFTIALLQGGQGSYIKPDHTSGLQHIGFTSERLIEGSSAPSTTITTKIIESHNGTRFSLTQGTNNRSLVVDIQDNEDYYTALMPRRTTNLEITDSDLLRDSVFSSHYTLAQSSTMFFTDSNGESALSAGVRPGDLLYVYEQVCTLDNTGVTTNPFSTKKDRVLHVRYNATSRKVSLLSTAGTFLTPESTNSAGESPEEDVVEVGDIVIFEALDQIARVTKVTATELTLDKSIDATAQPSVLKHGNDGYVATTAFASVGYQFTPSDIGNYLVIYGSENIEVDGTYSIDNVTGGVATISESIPNSESDLHWLIVKPSFAEVGESFVEGFSDTVGVTPIRIYRGTPSVFSIGDINHFIGRNKSAIEFLYGNVDGGPRRGVKQPYKIVRPSEYRITASQMSGQGTESSLYYFDVPTTTLTPTFDLNIPENTQYTPVVNSMKTSGYYLKTKDRATVFSGQEVCELIVDSAYIPKSLDGSLANTQSPETATITVTYESSGEASTLQAFLDSDDNRNLCADPLVRHYLPGYILLDITGSTADDSVAQEVIEYINGLSPTDSIRLSSIERILHQFNIDQYDHPIFIHCLTHDLNRDIILTRVDNYLDDDTILHDGTNRITFFIASEAYINIGSAI